MQMGVMRHLAEFLGVLSVPCRVSYLPLLHDILHSTNLFNWRLRQCLAVQLPALLLLPPRELVFNTLFTLVMTLLQDPVASVRRDSFLGVAKMIMILSQQADFLSAELSKMDHKESLVETASPVSAGSAECPNMKRQLSEEKIRQKKLVRQQRHHIAITAAHHVDIVANAVQTLIQGRSYRLRQLWVELSHALLLELPQHLFEKHFLDGLLYLASDPVSNVRVAVAAVFAGWQDFKPPISADDDATKRTDTNNNCDESLISGDECSSKLLVESSPWSWLLRRLDIAQCVMRLSVDHKDVYSVMVKLQPIFPHILFRAVSCKGRKEAPGGRNPVPNMNIGAFSQAATCVASPNALSSEAPSEGDSGGEDEDAEGVDGASSEDDGSPTWEPSSHSFAVIVDDDASVQQDATAAIDRRIGRSCDGRSTRGSMAMLAVEFEKEAATHRDTPAYRGSPLNNYLNSSDILITSISSPSRDGGPGFGVRSPSRKAEKSAILLQQQLEEIMQERSIHLEMRNSSSDGGECTSPNEGLSLGPTNLDAPIRAELELSLSLSPTARRRMSPGATILERTLSRDDSDDDDDTDTELEERASFNSCNRLQSLDNILLSQEVTSNISGYCIGAADSADNLLYMAPTGNGIKSGEQDSPPASSSSILGLLSTSVDNNPAAETASAFSDPRSTIVHSIFGQSPVLCISDNAQDSLNVDSTIKIKVTPLQSI